MRDQVVVGSFIAEGKKSKPEPPKHDPSLGPPQLSGFAAPSATSPPSQGTSSESSDDDPGSPMNHSGGGNNNSGHHVHSMPYAPVGWPHSANPLRHDP